jgi:hypothetical protein
MNTGLSTFGEDWKNLKKRPKLYAIEALYQLS